MRALLFLWFVLNVTYVFGFYAGHTATSWWAGVPFVFTSLVGVFALYRLRTGHWPKN